MFSIRLQQASVDLSSVLQKTIEFKTNDVFKETYFINCFETREHQ